MEYDDLYKLASLLKNGGASDEELRKFVANSNGTIPKDDMDVLVAAVRMEGRPLSKIADEWINMTTTWFNIQDLYRDKAITVNEKAAIKQHLYNLAKKGVLEHDRKIDGKYRVKMLSDVELDWRNADTSRTVDLWLPLGLHKWFTIYPKNILMFAGEKDSAKTAFAHSIIKMNMHNPNLPQPIELINSEQAAEEFKARLELHKDVSLDKWTHHTVEVSDHYADYIKTGKINIIDFLEPPSEFYLIRDILRDIYDATGDGVTIAFIQKDPKKPLGQGDRFSMEKSRLYCTLLTERPYNKCIVKSMKNIRTVTSMVGTEMLYTCPDGASIVEGITKWMDGKPPAFKPQFIQASLEPGVPVKEKPIAKRASV